MNKVGSAVFDNLPLIFAVGVAIGMAKKEKEVAALSAIGQPEQFYKFLKDYDVLKTITFDDHHQYAADDISSIEGNIITTEKDAVKLALLQRPDIYALKLKTVLDIEKLCYNSEGIKQPDNRA